MGQFYDKIWDEQRVFLFIYFKQYYYEHKYDENDTSRILSQKVSEIREQTKFFDKYGITNEDFKNDLISIEYCTDTNPQEDRIVIQNGILNDIREKLDEIYTIFISEKFLEFLYTLPMFSEKRLIVDTILRIHRYEDSKSPSDIKHDFIEFLIEHFCILANLFLQYKGKFIF